MTRAIALSAAMLTMLSGCSLAPKYDAPSLPVPDAWPTGDAYLTQSEAGLPQVTVDQIFRDPRLQALIAQAIDNNRDLRIAAANLAQARAQVRVTGANQLPTVSMSGSADYSDTGTTSGQQSYALQAGVSGFELDLFGRLANATEAERARALSTEAAGRTVRVGMIANLAEAWANYAADRDLLAVANDTAENARRNLALTRARLQGGVAPRTDVRQAEQILATAESDLALQKTALTQDENLIRLLVGAEFDRALLPQSLAEVTGNVVRLPAGTRSDILLRRPDVMQAEYLLRAANANIGVARARLFPTISLTSVLGLASNALSSLFTSNAFRANAGADASLAIFDGGARRAGVVVSEAQRDAALATYERAIQVAFREVADALADQGTLDDRLRSAKTNVAAAEDAAKLTDARYRGGVESFLGSLDAQRSLYNARKSLIAMELSVVRNRVELFRVLGGDSLGAAELPVSAN